MIEMEVAVMEMETESGWVMPGWLGVEVNRLAAIGLQATGLELTQNIRLS